MLLAEIKKIVCTLTYILFVIVMVGTYSTQMSSGINEAIVEPEPGLADYGTVEIETPSVLMPAATDGLIGEYLAGYYAAYPIMLYKEVHLKEADEAKIAKIIEKLTGLSRQELDALKERETMPPEYSLNRDLSYEEFKELMRQADEVIGGGSRYSEQYLISNFSNIPMTYEDARKEYRQIVARENLGKAYTRLFCDYMGIFFAAIAIFTAASFWNMDQRVKAADLIYSRKISSQKIVAVRLSALMVTMVPAIFLPYLHMMLKVSSLYGGMRICWGPAVLEMLLWLVPEMVFVVVLSALITEIVSPILSVFIQGAWWYLSLETNDLVGSINRWSLIIRHNTVGDITIWENQWDDFVCNRTYYAGLSIVLMVCLLFVYDLKRKGRIGFGCKGLKRNNDKKPGAVF